jgi:1-acyl-sn-glycerol-3-phosphate acyltransferase
MVRSIAETPKFQEAPHETNSDLIGLRSQLWLKDREDISYYDKAFFAALKTISGLVCDSITQVLNETHIENHDNFLKNLDREDRTDPETGETEGLLTVSNHLHYVDDPLIHAALIKFKYLLSFLLLFGEDSEYDNWKWTPAAKENFFYNPNLFLRKFFRTFFGRTKTVPILRGKGLEQLALIKLEEFLQNGDWVHIFGEGTRTKVHGVLNEFHPGVGKLVKRAPKTKVIAFGHAGLEEAVPWGVSRGIYDKQPKHSATQFVEKFVNEILENKTIRKFADPILEKVFKTQLPRENINTENNQVLRITDGILRCLIKTRKRIQVVVGEPLDMSELAASVPDTPAGYMIIAHAIRTEVEKCHKRAVELNQQAKTAQ